jgi:hypothetical protein
MVLTNQIAFLLQPGQVLLHMAEAPDACRLPELGERRRPPVFCDGVLAEAAGDLPLQPVAGIRHLPSFFCFSTASGHQLLTLFVLLANCAASKQEK